jgi:hypothetical protein
MDSIWDGLADTLFDWFFALFEWIVRNQLSRRNICDVERGRFVLKLKEKISERAMKKCSFGGGDKKSENAKSGLVNLPNPIYKNKA